MLKRGLSECNKENQHFSKIKRLKSDKSIGINNHSISPNVEDPQHFASSLCVSLLQSFKNDELKEKELLDLIDVLAELKK